MLGGEAAAWLGTASARLETNRDVQIVVFLASQMYLAGLCAEGVDAVASMGLSLGEFSHLVHIGALDLAAEILILRQGIFDAIMNGFDPLTALAAELKRLAPHLVES